MNKNIVIMLLTIVILALAAYIFWGNPTPTTAPVQTATTSNETGGMACAQVITSARNPKTGEIKQFPTPCDVPEGWVVIQNDVPGLDLQVQ